MSNLNVSVQPPSFNGATQGLGEAQGLTRDLSSNLSHMTSGGFGGMEANFNGLDSGFQQVDATFGGGGSSNPNAGGNSGNSKLPNPLRDYASYNYRIELGALSAAEVNTPRTSYRQTGLSTMIARSGGGNLGNRITTYAEDRYQGPDVGHHAEYYIEDLEIETVIAPNENTGMSQGTNIRFKIIEPYSMGQWIEALALAARSKRNLNYIEAPFCLKIDFLGQRDNTGASLLPEPPKYIPIKILNAEFSVNGEGCVYDVTAVPINEQANESNIIETQTDSVIKGETVVEILETGEFSLSGVYNGRQQTREDRDLVASADRYIIMFPPTLDGPNRAIDNARRNTTPGVANPNNLPGGGVNGPTIGSGTSVFDILQAYARSNINEIGRSKLVLDANEDRDTEFGQGNNVSEEDSDVFDRGSSTLQIEDGVISGQYPRGTNMEDVITEALINSEYGTQFATEQPENGKKRWFRIETQTFYEESAGTELQTGSPPKVYVYMVIPYNVDETSLAKVSGAPGGIELNSALAVKEYNYLYTGQNEDIIDFDINFEFAFLKNMVSDNAQTGNGQEPGQERVNPKSPPSIPRRPQVNTNRVLESTTPIPEPLPQEADLPIDMPGGIRRSLTRGAKAAIAQQFHDNIIHSNADMITANMTIWGDPYYIPTSGLGNYQDQRVGSRPINANDRNMNYQPSEVHVVVNFRTPLDYNSATGLMDFSDKQQMFSGLYRLISVNNSFRNGKFTQDLQMVRIPGQTSSASSNNLPLEEGGGALNSMNDRLTGTVGSAGSGIGAQGSPNDSGRDQLPSATPQEQNQQLNSNRPGVAPPERGDGSLATITTSIKGLSTQVATSLAPNFQGLIDELEQDLGYTINSIGGYNYRYISGTQTLSWHSGGVAIDINPGPNPFIRGRNQPVVTDMPNPPNGSLMTALATKYGLGWGGDWTSSKDAMHFSAAKNENGTIDVERGVIP